MRARIYGCLVALVAVVAPTLARADAIDLYSTNANTTNLTLVAVPPPGNQPLNIQCIICGTTQPQQDGLFGYNNYKQTGNQTTFNAFSTAQTQQGGVQLDDGVEGTAYSRAFLLAFLAATNTLNFNVGIDVNTATGQGAESLLRFFVLDTVNHTILSQYIGPTPLPTANNGTGFPDFLLTGFDINRNDLNANSQIEFFAAWSNASDGAESFFIVPGPSVAVPGPIAGAGLPGLVAAAMFLLGLARHRRRRA